ncbi:N-acetyltransferase [Bifidobacterium stellenboschense]|uniref:GNAT family acetyltransferase n=1 Tax=Bifidobacterium stellenboschense TaxID=762211 RepID=A0A087DQR2_9BIFI|nr:N-acetyltransferase [Bifidobacterium stellenboschense]KFI97862.1 GNAT family acetyltransferase [Bifidobacterium stellenboschense]
MTALKLVIERECSSDHRFALRRFVCCEPGGPEWAMDPQRYIRGLNVRRQPSDITRTLLVVAGADRSQDDVVGFSEYGVAVETTPEHEGVYQIAYIATALKTRGTHLGDLMLSAVLMHISDDAWRFNRTPLVLAQVDPRNKPSMQLFSRFGFTDEGPDPDDTEYRILALEFTPQEHGPYLASTLAYF